MVSVQPELDEYFRLFGCHHTSCGRVLRAGGRTAAAPWLEDKVRQPTVTREPIRHVIEGARAYNSARGLGDPHDIDFHQIRQTADRIHHLAREYDRLPHFDPKALPHFDAMRRQVHDQFDHLTNRMGVKAEFVDHDPYANSGEMAHDLANNRRIQVLKTERTGGHPFFSNHENDMFRAVHDVFGHAGTGRDFDKHGEEAAFHAHARMFTGDARPALASETRGQNGSLIYHGSFAPQKIALMDHSLWTPEGMQHTSATDWDEFRRVQDGQQRRYERAGVGGGQSERDEYFGRGEYGGRGQEDLITPKDWITHNRDERPDDIEDPAFHAEWAGYEMGHRHGRSGVDHGERDAAHASSTHPEDFMSGYREGLEHGHGRVAVLLGDDGNPTEYFVAMPSLLATQKTAHVSGNQIDVLHCFAGEERYLTPEGPKSFAETAGTHQYVLTSDDGVHDGYWRLAPIRHYGEQEIWELTITRNKRVKIIRTTAGHRWLVGRPGAYKMATTEQLVSGQRLAHLRPEKVDVGVSRDGVRQGVMFGDGSIARRDYGQGTYGFLTLWGDKVKDLSEYFDEISMGVACERENSLTGVRYTNGMAGWTKSLPSLNEPLDFLRGWLVGYLAADGDVDKHGKVSLSSSVIENLEHVRNVATLLGVGTYGIVTRVRQGYHAAPTQIYTFAFASGDLDSSWLLRQKHRDAFEGVEHGYDRFGWSVVGVERTDEIAPVYCAEVPGTESFALEDNIWTKNCPFCGSGAIVSRSDGSINCTFCNAAFTVTVAPLYSAFPQSVGGEPYPWPGRPDGGVDPSMMQMGDQPGGGFGGQLVPGGGGDADGDNPFDSDDDGDDDGNPFAKDSDSGAAGDSSGGGDDDDKEAEVDGKKKPPFGKKKSSSKLYKTAYGGQVPEGYYLKHLALVTARDPNAMAAKIRAERGA